jgi:hypothetical protein
VGSWNNWVSSSNYQIQDLTTQQIYFTQPQLDRLYYQIGMRPRRAIPAQPRTNFGAYEQRHRAIIAEQPEDEDMKEGFTGMLNTFLVGCDPEFVALNGSGTQLNLAPHFPDDGEIGFDHGGRVGEFRPEPTRGTYALTKRLQRLIKSPQIERLGASKLRAGARVGRDTLGGHVHLGFPVGQASKERVAALDRVTQVLEALDILPAAECSARRGGGAYGRFGDIRDSAGHTEYRTMASWLLDPKVAFLCLTAAKIAACDPKGTVDTLSVNATFNHLVEWFRNYRTKDINARRALERVLSLGHKAIQVYPDVDFRERWRELGL